MKIALITDNLNSGGAQRQLVTLAIGLKKKGTNVLFIVYNPGYHYEPVLEENDIPLIKILKSTKYDFLSVIKIINFIRSHKVDGIVAFLFTPSIIAALAKIFSKDTKLIVSERSYSSYAKERLTTKLARWLYQFADVITVNSLSQLKHLSTSYPKHEKKLKFIPNGLNLSIFRPPQNKGFKQTLELLCVGHVNRIKNTKLVIHALQILKQDSDFDFHLTWIGRNFDVTEQRNLYFEECAALIHAFKLENNWKWIPETADLLNYYHQADLLLHASIGEGFSNVVMEALSCGVPVVVSDVSDNSTVVKHGVNGFLFPSGDAKSVAEIILQYMQASENKRKELSLSARATATASFSEDKMIESYHNLLTT